MNNTHIYLNRRAGHVKIHFFKLKSFLVQVNVISYTMFGPTFYNSLIYLYKKKNEQLSITIKTGTYKYTFMLLYSTKYYVHKK